mgnify:CR=1 FL=1
MGVNGCLNGLLFVGMTRAQFRLECVLSERAAQLLLDRVHADSALA